MLRLACNFARDPINNNRKLTMKTIPTLILACSVLLLGACTRIETGEVGLRINFDKTTDPTERLPGSFNQTLVGSIVTFKIQDVAVAVDNMTPLASDNSTIKDFDMTVVYNVNPTAVSELWTTKNRTFHGLSEKGDDILLMQNYVALSARNAAYKAARAYESLKMADNRPLIEQQIRENIMRTLTEEKLADKITVSQVQVRAITPADVIVNSANDLVRAQNELKTKEVEVQTAKKEAERIAALNANAGAIGYMNAMANLKIAEGVAAGKVHTIVVPYDFKGIVNAK